MATGNASSIYSATYSNVPVYEFNVDGNHVMRRRQDDWINATHILKVADYDKPARTRILEREVQKGVHEKVQGGYGKYQGTWVPLSEGRSLAERNQVLSKLLPLFDFIPGPVSPPQAPKHQTAASTKGPRVPKISHVKRHKPKAVPAPSQMSEDIYDNTSAQFNDEDSVIHSEYGSESFMDDDDVYGQLPGSRKRKRGPELSMLEQQHTLYADNLLDYFMLSEAGQGFTLEPPVPPEGFQIDRAIDDQGHTALHWGAAMGDLGTIKLFIKRGAKIDVRNERGETPLIRAVLFTNNFEREMMPTLVKILQITITDRDNWGATIFHHVAMTTKSQSRKKCARYYLRVLLSTLRDSVSHDDFHKFLSIRDNNGDTALHIVARHNAKKCVKLLVGYGLAGDIVNNNGETADKILRAHVQRMDDTNLASSSPLQPSAALPNGHAVASNPKALSFPNSSHYLTQTAQDFSSSLEPIVLTKGTQLVLAYESEIGEKNDALNESTRLLQHAMDERQQIHLKTLDLSMDDPGEGDYERSRLAEQKATLEAENESFLEQEQHQRLHHEVAACERNVPPHKINGVSNSHSSVDIDDKTAAAHLLATEQERRRDLSREIGVAQALAGMTDKGEVFVRLVASSTGIEEDEVPGIVPDVLEEMERTRAEGSRIGSSAVFV